MYIPDPTPPGPPIPTQYFVFGGIKTSPGPNPPGPNPPTPPSVVEMVLLDFDTVGVGPGNLLTAIVTRLPLPAAFVLANVAFVAQSVTTSTPLPQVNIVYGETSPSEPSAFVATPGTTVFSTSLLLMPTCATAGVVYEYAPVYPACVYGSGGEFTLRVSTPAASTFFGTPGGGLAGLKVTLVGYFP